MIPTVEDRTGEGSWGGDDHLWAFDAEGPPLPLPPPAAGEGARAFLAGSSIVLGPS